MKYIRANKYAWNELRKRIMGPNPLKLLEELCALHPVSPEETVMDLGCGQGVTSVFIVREYGPLVFAADLWIPPTENKKYFDSLGLTSRQIIPLQAEAHALPFADEFFDTVISVDSYQYFGLDPDYLGKHLLPLVKHGGYLLITVPGMKKDLHENLPAEMLRSWRPEDLDTIHDAAYWRRILEKTGEAEIVHLGEMEGNEECWNDWLSCDNEYAVNDRAAMEAGAGKYMNFLAMILRRK
ncbi:SAM-dependent methyltransferase [Papillibacter cinnamivorans]|uniref:Cyclopropane fatty-acyl-phospholipid synthase n=1 Tax=Papillibacter cinnamivorans DSM 12816 TaxID=1122930 RepID=A0A1W1YWM4_9FIRM|nr:methyltransferase domain-containing protein [Papillibacter cinnamivorans]SMC40579.1 Cyclopropane fatty-acyl-phospholipid synthase [Papillibacter cinnamivorans DSM 12816]